MIADVEPSRTRDMPGAEQVYAPDILPRLQSVLAALADIDVAHEQIVEAIRSSPVEEERKDELIAGLGLGHRERRAPYVRELLALRERIDDRFG